MWSGMVDRRLSTNLVAVTVVQLTNYLVPLVLTPLITRAFGTELYGRLAYAQNITSYFFVCIIFGLDYTASRAVALNRENPTALNDIFSTVLRWRMGMFIGSLIALTILYYCFAPVHNYLPLYLLCAAGNFGYVLFPNFFLQGQEDLVKVSIATFIIRVTLLLAVIGLVKTQQDLLLYVALLSGINILVSSGMFVYTKRRYGLRGGVFKGELVQQSIAPFATDLINSLYYSVGVVLMGFVLTETTIGLYSGAAKLLTAVSIVLCYPFTHALYPRQCQVFTEDTAHGWHLFRSTLLVVTLLGTLTGVTLYALAPWLVKVFLGADFQQAVIYVRQMCAIPLLVVLATTMSINGLYALGKQRLMPVICLIAGITGCLCCYCLLPTLGPTANIICWYTAQALEIALDAGFLYKYSRVRKNFFFRK